MKTQINHRFFIICLFVVCIISLQITDIYAQKNKIKVTRFNASDGLTDNSIYSIIQDFQGFLWLGTRNGLHKYDGYMFKVYRNEKEDSSSIAQNWIYSFYEDKDKNLWVGSKSYISLYQRETDSFKNYKILQNDVGMQSVSAISEDEQGRIWLVLSNHDIYVFNPETERFTAAREIYEVLDKTFDFLLIDGKNEWNWSKFGVLTALLCGDSSEVWIGTSNNGLYRLNTKTGNILHFKNNHYNKNSLSNNHIKNIFKCKDGIIWIGTNEGLNRYDQKTELFAHYLSAEDDPYSIAANIIHNIAEDNQGNLWVVTLDGWVNFLKKESNKFLLHKKLASLRISPVHVDRSGIIWVGSIGEGLFKLDPGIIKFNLYTQKPDTPHSIYGNYIQAIETDNDGNIWIGGEQRGIHKINRQTVDFSFYKTHNFTGHPIVHDLLFDDQTGIWAATNNGVFIFDKSGKKLNTFLADPDNPHSISESQINNIFKDSKANIWAATNSLNLYDRKTGNFSHFYDFETNQSWYPILSISESEICEDKDGNFWIGTYIMGLLKFNPKTKLFKGFKKSKNEMTSVFHMLIDKRGRLWYSKNNQGLTLFDINSEREIKQITEKDGLLHNAVQGIEEDDSGNLWISSNRGLTRYNPEMHTFKHYYKEDGLQDNEFRFYSSHKNNKGELFFGGQYGLNVFHPDSIKDHDYIAPVVFTDFKISAATTKPGKDSPFKKNINVAKQIDLAYDQNDLSISFTALDFSLPERNKYSYILENYEDQWRPESNRNYAEYTNLDPGEYTFKVKGTNHDGVWNPQPATLKIVILSPWWQTWWSYTSYVLIILTFIFALRRYELNRLHFKNQARVETIKLKEREEVDRLKTTFFTNISHEFRTPLTLIIGPLNRLVSESANKKDFRAFKTMQRNAKRLLSLINQLLDISKLESGKMQLDTGLGNIVPFVKGILMSFHSLAEHKNISVKFTSDAENIDIFFDREKAEKIFTNILSNAFKFTPEGGEVNVKIYIPHNPPLKEEQIISPLEERMRGVYISVSNSGPGIASEKLPHIFDRFYQADDTLSRGQEGTGIGLALTKELVELHHGSISVTSDPDKETKFIIVLPLGSDHLKHEEIIAVDSSLPDEEIQFEDVEIETSSEVIEQSNSEVDKSIVLVVEDNKDMRHYIYDTLKNVYHIEQAFDGEAGVKAAKELIPDLIVSDLMMPKKNGYQLCSDIKQDKITSHIPVILLTAKAEREDKLQGLETGADDYLIKPFDSKELLTRIKNLVEQRQRLRKSFTSTIKVEPKDITVTSMDAEFLQTAMDIVEENINNEQFSVELMSETIGLSRRQLYQKIKALTDFTPTDFVLNLRLKKAASLLSQKAGTVSEVAFAVGFSNLSYFARAFKKQFGSTPSKYTDN